MARQGAEKALRAAAREFRRQVENLVINGLSPKAYDRQDLEAARATIDAWVAAGLEADRED